MFPTSRMLIAAAALVGFAGCKSADLDAFLQRSREAAGVHAKGEAARLIDGLLPPSVVADEPAAGGPATASAVAEPDPAAQEQPEPPAPGSREEADDGEGTAWTIVANPDLKGRLGRIVVDFPAGADVRATSVRVAGADAASPLAGKLGSSTFDLLPNHYLVTIADVALAEVPVRPRCDTIVSVGAVRVTAAADTRTEILAADSDLVVARGLGSWCSGLPAGGYRLRIAGLCDPVTIAAGQIVEL